MGDRRDEQRRTWWRNPLVGVLLLFVAVAAPFVQDLTAQGAPRFAFAAAVVDDGTIRLDAYEQSIGIDVAEVDGHLYSDKAPGQMIWALPFYAIGDVLGFESPAILRVRGNLGLWWQVLWSSLAPTAALLALMWHHLRTTGTDERRAAVAVGVMALGTPLLPFATELYGHALAGLAGYAAWLVLRVSQRPVQAAGAGLLVSLAVTIEYPMVLVAGALGVVLLVGRRWRELAAFSVTGLLLLPPLLLYHDAAFGGPFETGYSEKPLHEGSPVVVHLPEVGQFVSALAGRRGLLLFSPVLVIALVGMVRLARGADQALRRDAAVGLGVFAAFVLMQSGMPDPWGGDNHGPRYVLPALPFLVPGLAHAWRSFQFRWHLAAFSITCMGIVTMAFSLVAMDDLSVVRHLRSLIDGGPQPTLFTLALGWPGWIVHGVLIVAAGAVLVRACPRSPADVASEETAVTGSR